MKVLFLTRYPVEGASSRYRVFQYIPFLEQLGVSCRVDSFMDKALYELSFAPGRTTEKIAATLQASRRRWQTLQSHRDYDLVFMQRELFPFGPPIAERWMKRRGARLVFDYDDALFIKKPSRYNPLSTLLRSSEKTFEVFKLCDCVVAGNDWLRDMAAQYCKRAVTVEVAEDADRVPTRSRYDNSAGLLIGWLGSKSTVKYLRLVEDALREVHSRFPKTRFEIVGGGEFDLPGLPVTHTEWSFESEVAALARFDIGIMPLPLEEWSRGKSGGKARTYMAAGVPPVCTRIGYNCELIRDGETGLLCETREDWVAALSALIENTELRQRLATAARADVELRFSPSGQALKLFTLFRELIDETGGTSNQ